ncbi:MAG: hypothetical protein KGZ83_18650 [Sulfuricella sp.]|nr:hypothetical protein [Sulfuricella sp.]
MNAFLQIIWMIFKIALFGLALLLMFGGGACGIFFVFGGFHDQSMLGWGVLALFGALVSGVAAVKLAKSFKNRAPQQPQANQPAPDDGSGWDKVE